MRLRAISSSTLYLLKSFPSSFDFGRRWCIAFARIGNRMLIFCFVCFFLFFVFFVYACVVFMLLPGAIFEDVKE